jgi:hypothetical protein
MEPENNEAQISTDEKNNNVQNKTISLNSLIISTWLLSMITSSLPLMWWAFIDPNSPGIIVSGDLAFVFSIMFILPAISVVEILFSILFLKDAVQQKVEYKKIRVIQLRIALFSALGAIIAILLFKLFL